MLHAKVLSERCELFIKIDGKIHFKVPVRKGRALISRSQATELLVLAVAHIVGGNLELTHFQIDLRMA